jgi:serine/threonine-protein kinase RsbW
MVVNRREDLTRPPPSPSPIPLITDLRMASRREEIAPAVEKILDLAEPAELDRERRQDLAVAVAEALANAAVHGNHLRPETLVEIRVEVLPHEQVAVTVTDKGGGFDTATLADPTAVPNLLVPRGRGVFLMQRLVDRVEFNPRGNSVRLTLLTQQTRKRCL